MSAMDFKLLPNLTAEEAKEIAERYEKKGEVTDGEKVSLLKFIKTRGPLPNRSELASKIEAELDY